MRIEAEQCVRIMSKEELRKETEEWWDNLSEDERYLRIANSDFTFEQQILSSMDDDVEYEIDFDKHTITKINEITNK